MTHQRIHRDKETRKRCGDRHGIVGLQRNEQRVGLTLFASPTRGNRTIAEFLGATAHGDAQERDTDRRSACHECCQ